MKFRTIYEPIKVVCKPGSQIIQEYQLTVEPDGHSHLIPTTTFNGYDEIQSYRDSSDPRRILERYAKTNDESLLERRKAFFLDVAELPKDYAGWLQLYRHSIELFNSMPAEAKLDFNNDPDQFYASIGTEKFKKYFEKKEPVPEAPSEEKGDILNE